MLIGTIHRQPSPSLFLKVDGVAEASVEEALKVPHLTLQLFQAVFSIFKLLLLPLGQLLLILLGGLLVHVDEGLADEELEALPEGLLDELLGVLKGIQVVPEFLDFAPQIVRLHIVPRKGTDLLLVVAGDLSVLLHKGYPG